MQMITQTEQANKLLMSKLGWLGQNRGILSQIARKVGVTPSFVRIVFRGGSTSSGGAVEAALAAAGAPGFLAVQRKGRG